MRNKLFTAAVNKQLANQYKYGSDLSKQKVVTKIFNPYGEGRWYLLNSDPNDPDYIWAIVSMYGNVEVGSVSRRELESLRLTPFRLPLERDIYFDPINAEEVFNGLVGGKFYAKGGEVEKDWYDIRSYSIAEHGEDGAKKMAEKYIDEHIKYWKGQVTADELKIRKSPFGGQDYKGEYVVMKLFPKFAKGGVAGYERLVKKVAKNYEGKNVPRKYQSEYGKTYNKEEAKEVGYKVATKVYGMPLAKMKK